MGTSTAKRVLIITPDRIGERIAGIGIRHVEIAEALSQRGFEVILASTDEESSDPKRGFRFVPIKGTPPKSLLAGQDACIVQGTALRDMPALRLSDIPVAVDLICPFFLENLERYRGRRDIHLRIESDLDLFREALQVGDYFFCGSPRQRHFWLGMLSALGRVNGLTAMEDPSLASLIGVVPFGVSFNVPPKGPGVLKGVHPGIAGKDVVFLWGGGIWEWTDPLTPLKALAEIRGDHPEAKIFFTGFRHPQRPNDISTPARRAWNLSKKLGLMDRQVFFYDGWIPYEERQAYFFESDVGLSTHIHSLENIFAVRTRFWDYLGAGLPLLATRGDWVSDLVESRGLGITVPPGDTDAMAEGMVRLMDAELRAGYGQASRSLGLESGWDAAVDDLVKFLSASAKSADHRAVSPYKRFGTPGFFGTSVSRFFASLLQDGWASTISKLFRILR